MRMRCAYGAAGVGGIGAVDGCVDVENLIDADSY